jgi:hypothetical protein
VEKVRTEQTLRARMEGLFAEIGTPGRVATKYRFSIVAD